MSVRLRRVRGSKWKEDKCCAIMRLVWVTPSSERSSEYSAAKPHRCCRSHQAKNTPNLTEREWCGPNIEAELLCHFISIRIGVTSRNKCFEHFTKSQSPKSSTSLAWKNVIGWIQTHDFFFLIFFCRNTAQCGRLAPNLVSLFYS